jgi:hypothetical protein
MDMGSRPEAGALCKTKEVKMEWYDVDPRRFECEVMLLKKHYPKTRIFIQRGQLTLYHKVKAKKTKYLAKIIYPYDFPYGPPEAYIIEPKLPNIYEEIHRFADGNLCLAPPDQVGPQTSGLVICDWTVDWVAGYEIWLKTGVFPATIRRRRR